LLLVLAVAGGCATSHSGSSNAAVGRGDDFVVRVVDEAGAALGGVAVTGKYETTPGPTASTCCREVGLGPVKTGSDGVARLARPPATLSPVTIVAERPGWPAQNATPASFGVAGLITITLGPPREIRGQVAVPDDCPGGFLEVAASPSSVRAPVTPDGRFILPGMGPGPITIGVSACGRSVTAAADGGAHRQVMLLLPPSGKRARYPTQATAQPRPSPAELAPGDRAPGPLRCALGGGEPLIPGDFDLTAVDPDCRWVLARERVPAPAGARSWQLARPGAAPLHLGGLGADPPLVGRRIAVGEVLSDRRAVETVELASGSRHALGLYARVALAAGDVVVLYSVPPSGGGPEPGAALELLSPDGRRRVLATRAAADWSLFEDGLRLAYRTMAGGNQTSEAHVYDLAAGRDLTIAAPADGVWSFAGAREVVVRAGDGLVTVGADGTHRQPAAEPASAWQVLGPDLFVSRGARGSVTVRTGPGTVVIPFAWGQQRPRLHRMGGRYLLLESDGDLVVVDRAAGDARLLAEGVRLSTDVAPPVSGDRIAVQEMSGRTLVLSLSGRERARAVGRGTPRSFSPDGRWLAVEAASSAAHIDLVPVDGGARAVAIPTRGGQWATAAPSTFLYSATAGDDAAPPLLAVDPDHATRRQVAPRAVSYRPLRDGDVLVVIPPQSGDRPGIWRRGLAAPPPP